MEQLNIKNRETYQLAKELSQLTGENVTQAVTRSLKERLENVRIRLKTERKGLAETLLDFGNECASLPTLDNRAANDILYDENGLPKTLEK